MLYVSIEEVIFGKVQRKYGLIINLKRGYVKLVIFRNIKNKYGDIDINIIIYLVCYFFFYFQDGFVKVDMEKLIFYVVFVLEKFDRIGFYLVERLSRDVVRYRFG